MDIATLGIGIDSRQVDDGKRSLDNFSNSAEKAEKSAAGVGDGAKKGAKGVDDLANSMASASLKGNLAADAITKAVDMAIEAVKALYALMSEAGDYADLADMTGASAVNIAKLQTAADVAGVSMQGMAGYMNQMTRVLKSTDEESDKAAQALARINLKFEDLQKLDPAERIAAVAQAMGKYADGAEKTEVAQALFGRGAGAVLKVMKELSDASAFSTRLTQESIDAVDGLNDASARFTSQSRQYIQAILVGTVPATEAFKLVIKETTASMFGMGDAADSLSANQGMGEFAKQTGYFLTTVLSAFQVVYRAVESLIQLIQTLVEFLVNLITLDFSGVMGSIEKFVANIRSIWKEDFAMTSYQKKLDAMGKSARDAAAMAAGGEAKGDSEERARIAKAASEKEAADAKKQSIAFDAIIGANAAKASGYNTNFIEQMKNINAESKVRNYTEAQYKAAVDALIAQQPFYTDGVKKHEKAVTDAEKKTEEYNKLVIAGDLKKAGYNDSFVDQMKLINDESAKANITEAQKQKIIQNLIQQQPFYTQGIKDQAEAAKEYIDAEKKAFEAADKDREAVLKKSGDAATAAEAELENFGKLKSEIAATTLLRLQDLLAVTQADPKMREFYEQQIRDQQRVIAAMKGVEIKEAAKKAADDSAKIFEKAWEQVGQSLSDAIIQGGVKAKDLLLRMFKAMVLQPTIMAGMQYIGGGAGGTGIGGTASSLASNYGNLSNLAGSAGLAGGMGNIAAGYAGATGAGAGIVGTGIGTTGAASGAAFEGYMAAGGYAATSGATSAGVAGGLASGTGAGASAAGTAALGAIPVAGWVALAAVAAYMLYKKYGKSGGPKVEGSAGLGAGGLIGAYGSEMDPSAMRAVNDLNSQYRRMATMLGSSQRSMEFGVGISTDPRGTAQSMVQIRSEIGEVVNRDVGRSQEELMKALSEASSTVMVEALRNSGMDAQMLAYFDKITVGMTDEAKVGAFEQVAAVGQYWKQLQAMGNVVKGLSNISLDAAVSLAELSGGVQNLAAGLSSYQKNFFTTEEQSSIAYQQMAATLNEAGSGWQGFSEQILRSYTKDRFREIVEGLNLEDEGDRMRYASMMKVADAFATQYDATHKVISAEEKLANAREAAADKYAKALDTLHEAYDRQVDVLTTTRDAMKDASKSFYEFNESLRVDQTLSNLNPQERMQQLELQYGAARSKTVAGGYQAEDVQRMQDTARALLQGGREFYGSGSGYDELFKKITTEMEVAGNATRWQQDTAERQLQQLNMQVGYLFSIDKTLISVNQALWELNSARSEVYALGYPHAEGLSRVPFNNYPALLHTDEMVLPQNESAFIRGLPDFSGELRQLRQEVAALRKENRQDAGNTIGATFTAAQQSAQVQSEATIRAARQRLYQSRSRPVLA